MNTLDKVDQYFQSYEDLEVHQLMLQDKVRTLAYRNAILEWREKFKGKIVMDVGAGTGILSIFCAQVGASKVFAVEASKLAKLAEKVVNENNLQGTIEIIQKRVEDLEPNVIGKVDIIISEWMGFYLVHEGMLDCVLVARDRFLRDDGLMFPSIAKLYAAPCQLPSFFESWDNVCGVSMKCVGKEYRRLKSLKPEILTLKQNDLLAEGKMLAWLDLHHTTLDELNIFGGEEYVLPCNKDGKYQGMCIWFAVEFPNGSELSTGPMDDPTHWKQTVIILPTETQVEEGEPIAFKLQLNKDISNLRQYSIELIMLDSTEVEHDIPCHCRMTKCIVTRTYMEEHGHDTLTHD